MFWTGLLRLLSQLWELLRQTLTVPQPQPTTRWMWEEPSLLGGIPLESLDHPPASGTARPQQGPVVEAAATAVDGPNQPSPDDEPSGPPLPLFGRETLAPPIAFPGPGLPQKAGWASLPGPLAKTLAIRWRREKPPLPLGAGNRGQALEAGDPPPGEPALPGPEAAPSPEPILAEAMVPLPVRRPLFPNARRSPQRPITAPSVGTRGSWDSDRRPWFTGRWGNG